MSYWGSVRFFKHVIIGTLAGVLIIANGTAIYLGTSFRQLAEKPGVENSQNGEGKESIVPDSVNPGGGANVGQPEYRQLYPDLYVENDFKYEKVQEKTVYLTFDGGPSKMTVQILNTLKQHGAKATFFMDYDSSDSAKELYRRMAEEGHTLAVRGASGDYKKTYESVEAYLKNFAAESALLEEAVGKKPEILRFPGGSINIYNRQIAAELTAEMKRRGYTYYDWDVNGGDTGKSTTQEISSNVISGVRGDSHPIVRLHDRDSSKNTAAALGSILSTLGSEGYVFEALNQEVEPICFDSLH